MDGLHEEDLTMLQVVEQWSRRTRSRGIGGIEDLDTRKVPLPINYPNREETIRFMRFKRLLENQKRQQLLGTALWEAIRQFDEAEASQASPTDKVSLS